MGPTAVVKFANLFEFDSTALDLKLASDFPRVFRTNFKHNAEAIRKSASRPRLDKKLVSSILVRRTLFEYISKKTIESEIFDCYVRLGHTSDLNKPRLLPLA